MGTNQVCVVVTLCLCLYVVSHKQLQYSKMDVDMLRSYQSRPWQGYLILILDTQLIDPAFIQLPQSASIKYFSIDCSEKFLKACQPDRNVPILILNHKFFYEYQTGWGVPKHAQPQLEPTKQRENILTWIDNVMAATLTTDINTKQQIEQLMSTYGDIFLSVKNTTVTDHHKALTHLAQEFYYKQFVFFTDVEQAEGLGMNLTEGMFVHYSRRKQMIVLPAQTQSYDIWRKFVIQQLYPEMQPVTNSLTTDRFNPQKLRDIHCSIIFCDLGPECIDFMSRLNTQLGQHNNNNNNQQQIELIKIIVEAGSYQISKIIELYYHVKLSRLRMPVMFVVDGEDPENPGVPLRYVKQLDRNVSVEPLEVIRQFELLVKNRDVKAEYLCGEKLAKQGFIGKGSQKYIQKLTYENYKQKISEANARNINYALFITARKFNCKQCEQAYSEYKKLASYLHSQPKQYAVFGMLDLSHNQISLNNLKGIPSLVIFTPKTQQYISFNYRFTFDLLLKFIMKSAEQQPDSDL